MARRSEGLLSLSGAAERLGVHPTTLRRWANAGDVAVVYTPGGHRRFAVDEVERIARDGEPQPVPAAMPAPEVLRAHALTHTRTELAGQHHPPEWMARMDAGARDEQRVMGRRLLGLMMQFVALAEGDENAGVALLDEANAIGEGYAEQAHRAGLSITEALQATMFFRDNLVESALLLPEGVRPGPDANRRLLRRINTFLNAVQLAIAETYRG